MTLNKAIQSGKEHRKKYYNAKAVSKSCRNNGGCPYCEGSRRHKELLQKKIVKWELKEALNEQNIKEN